MSSKADLSTTEKYFKNQVLHLVPALPSISICKKLKVLAVEFEVAFEKYLKYYTTSIDKILIFIKYFIKYSMY